MSGCRADTDTMDEFPVSLFSQKCEFTLQCNGTGHQYSLSVVKFGYLSPPGAAANCGGNLWVME
eukprot:6212724-Pleurochrysis_carterae.AAC.5